MYNTSVAASILSGLNPQQREAVETIDGPVLIVAGPGSGKTRVITQRIAYLVDTCGVSPYRIAAVTFTNKAAREMKERASSLIRSRDDQLTIKTFHAFCASVLRRDGERLGLNKDFSIYDHSDQTTLMKRAMQEVDLDIKLFKPANVLSEISGAKSQIIGVEGYGLNISSYYEEIVHRAYEKYEELLAKASALDFDDLLYKVYLLFKDFPDVADRYRERYVHVMIDEFQDTNVAQYEIAKQLTGEYRNLCVVGDPDQSIYSWRNADIRNILSFQKDFPDSKVIALEQNYRSTEIILQAAQEIISSNKQRVEKELFTANGKGVPIVVEEAYNEQEEAQFVVREIERLARRGYARADIAVMYRVNAQSRALEEACMRYGVPYQLVGSTRFYQRQEIKDLICYLRLIVNRSDDVSFGRIVNIPTRGIGQRTVDELTRHAREHGLSLFDAIDGTAETADTPRIPAVPLPARSIKALQDFKALIEALSAKSTEINLVELIDEVLERTGYKEHVTSDPERGEDRWDNMIEFRTSAQDYLDLGPDDALTAFLENVSLVSDTDNLGEKADAVTLITLHQAKGLEYSVVFMVGMEEGLLPHSRSVESRDPAEIEEERRLCYVGITRAKEMLYLLRAFRRGFRGNSEPSMPSRFLADIPQELITKPSATAPAKKVTSGRNDWGSPFKQTQRPSAPAERVVNKSPGAKVIRRRRGETRAVAANAGPALNTGDKVRHKAFGEGIVTATKPSGGDTEVTVAFRDGHGVKRLLLSFALLEKVE